MRALLVSAAFVVSVWTSQARADDFFAVTPSGAAETLFAEPPAEVIGKISTKCIDARWTVSTSTPAEVICEAPMNFGQSLMGQMLMGNSYSTPPRRFFKYTISTISGVSRVQASGWMELQMAFGQVRRTDFSGAPFHNGAMNFMVAAGGRLPRGTSFPNHVFLGVGLEILPAGKSKNMKVTSVEPALAAAQAGIQVGDVITTIAQKRFKDDDDFLDALAKAAKTPTFAMEIIRDGNPVKLTVSRMYRPTYDEVTVALVTAPTASMTPTTQLSVADELAKLAKLKSDGLISQAEFDQQKAKLLAQ